MDDTTKLARALRRTDAVQAVLDLASGRPELDDFVGALLDELRTGVGAGVVTLLALEGEELVPLATRGHAEDSQDYEAAGRVVRTREPVVTADTAIVALLHRGEALGALAVHAAGADDLRDDMVLVDLVAQQAAAALAHVRAEEARRTGEARTRLLADFSHELNANIGQLERSLQLVAERIAMTIGDSCALYLLSDEGDMVEAVALHHRDPGHLVVAREFVAPRVTLQSDLGTVVKTGETMTRFELGREEFLALLTPEQEALLGERYVVSSLITVPLRARGEVIGAANIARTLPGASRYTEADRVFLEELADRAAVAIDNARLFAQANASQQRFRALLDSSRIGFVARDADGRVVETNQAYAAMMGYDHREELYGTTPDAVIHEDARDEAVATFAQAFSGAADRIEVERDYVRRDGSVMHARVSTSLLRDEHGDPLYALSIVEDVGRQRSLELQLRESQKMDALGRFAGAIAHDFNNVLTAIAGFNELIAADLGPDHPLHGETAEIAAAAEHAAGLTRQLLTFSRHQVVAAEVLSVGDLVQDLAPMLARLLGEDVELAVAVTDAPSAVRADRNQLEQVMVNLVVNARDAMPHGGRLTIGVDLTEIDEEGAGSRLAVDPGTYVRLAVSDTGHGIDDETQRRMFEPFFTTKAPDKGTGLGLSTVFGIIEQSGGSVAVYSEPGHGTTMRVYLPYTQERAPVADEAPPARTPRRSPAEATVLVVDDEPSVRLVVMRILERDGYTVLTAGDGDEALEIARTHPGQIDVMITDVVLPGLQGPEIAERLHELRPDTGILYSSGYPGDEIVRRGIDPDASYIEKPFSHDALLAAVADLLAGA